LLIELIVHTVASSFHHSEFHLLKPGKHL
jgi:hypothetical protein